MEENRKKSDEALVNNEKQIKSSGHRLIKKRSAVLMPKAKYDGAFEKENHYYIKIANRYAILKYVFIFLAFIFAVSMLTSFSTDITAENFQYLLKDLDITGIMSGSSFDSVIYNGDSTSSFGIYRGELAVINAGSTMMYKPSGALSFERTNVFYNPRLLISDKYMLVYDRGNTTCSYSVYNSFAELHSERYEHPITLAELSDSGSYAIVTRDDSFRSIVYVYDDDFKLINEIKKDKYVLSLSLSDDGKRLAVASVYDKYGYFETEILVLGAGSGEADFAITEKGKIPLDSHWLENGNLCVLYSDSVSVYTPKGEKASELDLSSLSSHSFALNETLMVSAYNTTVLGYDKTVNVYDKNAELIYSVSLEGELIKIVLNEKKICILFEDRAVLVDPFERTVKEAKVKPNAKDVVFYGDTVIVCYSGGAEPAEFKK